MINAAIALVRLGSAPIGFRPLRVEFGRRGTICFPLAVPELASTSKQDSFAFAHLWAWPLLFGAPCNGLPLFWARLRSRPAHNLMLLPINPRYACQVARRPRNTIQPDRSRRTGTWRSQEGTLLSHRTKRQPRHRSRRAGLPASTRKEQRLHPARRSIRTNRRPRI